MAVFPESMDKLDANDVRGSFATIENYIRYMTERMEFSMRNMTKTVSAAGVSSAEMYILLTALQNDMASLKSTVNGMVGNINSLSSQVGEMQSTVQTLQNSVSTLDGKITAVESSIATLNNSVSSLDARVTALENPTT